VQFAAAYRGWAEERDKTSPKPPPLKAMIRYALLEMQIIGHLAASVGAALSDQ
jgi:hypothetical protein